MMSALPTPDMAGWSVGDYELAFEAAGAMADCGNGFMCQPRAGNEFSFFPGAASVAEMVESLDRSQTAMIDSLRASRFDSSEDEARRLRLLVRYELDELPLAKLKMLLE